MKQINISRIPTKASGIGHYTWSHVSTSYSGVLFDHALWMVYSVYAALGG